MTFPFLDPQSNSFSAPLACRRIHPIRFYSCTFAHSYCYILCSHRPSPYDTRRYNLRPRR
ncbi:hypothetical protein BofuT4_uP067530.1 [Botrytis cinerea T4]|uniref:Uncharacterized protein n=1 Tax=Botryotinia fuckeliana (strain T4) TaxID=999810 RepID=G2XRH7_BOTF4|nr:hypothetical protein BofuT4_uP067530.1 [Botrytis cinerea T4]